MKRVVIVRHAKAVQYGYHDDFNRHLTDRGKNDAKLVSKELNNKGIIPDAIISSPAVRAMETARIFAKNLNLKKKNINKIIEIYEGMTSSEFLDIIKKLPYEFNTVFFFGHNPSFYTFTCYLLQHYNDDMPTCATIGIDLMADKWEKVEPNTGILAFRLVPKMFR